MGLARSLDELIPIEAEELKHKDPSTLVKLNPRFNKPLAPLLHEVTQIAEGRPPMHLTAAGSRPSLMLVTLLRLGVNPGSGAR